MANQEWPPPYGEEVAEKGPDYVALVIEWDDLEDDVTEVFDRPEPTTARKGLLKKIAIGAGALGALLFARWGIHRLRA